MPALITGPNYAPAADDLYATARIDGPLPLLSATPVDQSGPIDQAYSEYRNLCAAGVEVDPDAFCARFPTYQTSLRRLLEVHREIEANPELLRKLDRWPAPGDTFYGFQLEQELGRGAFARVFLAREHAVGNRQVVVKVSLHADDEADTLGRLRHPNVVQVHSAQFDEEGGFSVVCMPFLGGATLLRVIESLAARKGPPDLADVFLTAAKDDRIPADNATPPAWSYRRGNYLDGVLYLGERLASALTYVHDRGILHRDLKPSNVLLCPNGEPVLIDFNLAHDRSINEHRLGGTLPYMPPEQLITMTRQRQGEPVPADARADLYALGVLMYELLAGAHPFGPVPLKLKTADAREFLLGRQKRGPRSLRRRNRAIDPALDSLIVRCLSHDPAGRPSTARELVTELRRLQAPIRRVRRWFVAHAKAAAVATVLVGASGTYAGVQIATMPTRAQKAERLYRDGNYRAAIEEFDLALAADDDQPAVHFARGRAYLMLGKTDTAYSDFMKANPETDARTMACLGYAQSLLGAPVKAVSHYQDAIRAGFANGAVRNNMAYSLAQSGKFHEAEIAATDALESAPELRAAYYNRAIVRLKLYEQAGDPGLALDALNDMRQAINRGTTTAQAYYFASVMAAYVLHDRLGDPKKDPLYAEGAAFLRSAIDYGYNLTRPLPSFRGLICLGEWEKELPPDVKSKFTANGTDVNICLLDPISD